MKENGTLLQFLYHRGELLQETGEDSKTSYCLGAGIEGFQRDQKTYYYHQDEQLSTTLITNQSGESLNHYQYDAFGSALEKVEGVSNRIQYTNQQYDGVTGQYYLRARYYNPILGRFLQEDVYQGDGQNLYAYCGNNPVMYYDPSGYAKDKCPPGGNFNGDGGEGNVQAGELYQPPKVYKNAKGQVTNATYTIDSAGMKKHLDGTSGKSQFLFDVDADKAVLDAADYANINNLWKPSSGNPADFADKAKIPVINGNVGVTGDGQLSNHINIYRTKTGFVHGCPGNP